MDSVTVAAPAAPSSWRSRTGACARSSAEPARAASAGDRSRLVRPTSHPVPSCCLLMIDELTRSGSSVRPARACAFCLPFAGGGASTYRSWVGSVRGVDIVPVQLPGREMHDRLRRLLGVRPPMRTAALSTRRLRRGVAWLRPSTRRLRRPVASRSRWTYAGRLWVWQSIDPGASRGRVLREEMAHPTAGSVRRRRRLFQ